jgi:hypothetical protein
MATSRQKFAIAVQAVANSASIIYNISAKSKILFNRLVTVDIDNKKAERLDKAPENACEIRILHTGTKLVMAVTSTPYQYQNTAEYKALFAHSPELLDRLDVHKPNVLRFMQLGGEGLIPNLLPSFGFESLDGQGETWIVTPGLDILHKNKLLPPTEMQKKHLVTIAQVTRMSSSRIEVPINVKYAKH